MEQIKVLVVEPNKTPKVVMMDNNLSAMQEIVGGLIQPVYPMSFKDDAIIVCNEEGKLLGLEPNIMLFDEQWNPYDFVCGTCFICRAPEDSEDFESLTEEQISHYFEMYV